MTIGVYPGKFLPPHRGHLYAILKAATMVDKLYVVLSHNTKEVVQKCAENNLPYMSFRLRKQWLCQEFQDMEHIEVVLLDESDIPQYPNGWEQWTKLLVDTVPECIDVIFGSEESYIDKYAEYLPGCKYIKIDTLRDRFPISATMIRANPMKYWDYILGPARPFFAKRVLIAGTESVGKTTLTKALSKILNTSWSSEVGRDYASEFLGGDESIFVMNDFARIGYLQKEQDYKALRTANKVCIFDTDAVITQYYCRLYMGDESPQVESMIDPDAYDIVLLLSPDVKWVDDGMRLNGDPETRRRLHQELINLYLNNGFSADKITIVEGSYTERLEYSLKLINTLISEEYNDFCRHCIRMNEPLLYVEEFISEQEAIQRGAWSDKKM